MSWNLLPNEILLKILFYLEPQDLIISGVTNKLLNNLCKDDSLWKPLTVQKIDNLSGPVINWYLTFIMYHEMHNVQLFAVTHQNCELSWVKLYTNRESAVRVIVDDAIEHPEKIMDIIDPIWISEEFSEQLEALDYNIPDTSDGRTYIRLVNDRLTDHFKTSNQLIVNRDTSYIIVWTKISP